MTTILCDYEQVAETECRCRKCGRAVRFAVPVPASKLVSPCGDNGHTAVQLGTRRVSGIEQQRRMSVCAACAAFSGAYCSLLAGSAECKASDWLRFVRFGKSESCPKKLW